jgi:hypothetical protein
MNLSTKSPLRPRLIGPVNGVPVAGVGSEPSMVKKICAVGSLAARSTAWNASNTPPDGVATIASRAASMV